MDPGGWIAVGAWGAIAGLIVYGLSFDARRWRENRRQWTEQRERELAALRQARVECQWENEQAIEDLADWFDEAADWMDWVRSLPTREVTR